MVAVLVSACIAWFAHAQPPSTEDEVVDPYEEILGGLKLSEEPAPVLETLSIEGISSAQELYDLLTSANRCPEKKTVQRRVPCAFVSYTALTDQHLSLRPVFKVEGPNTIWTFLDGKLAEITRDDLFEANDLGTSLGTPGKRYPPVVVIGYFENKVNCGDSKLPCIDASHFGMFLSSSSVLTYGCADQIWGQRTNYTEHQFTTYCDMYIPDRN